MRLVQGSADPFARAVDVSRPRVGSRHLKPARKAAIHAPLHRMVRRISLGSAILPPAHLRIKARPSWIQRIDEGVGFARGHELMALRPDVRTIDYNSIRKLAQKT